MTDQEYRDLCKQIEDLRYWDEQDRLSRQEQQPLADLEQRRIEEHQRRAIAVYRSLEAAGVAERRRDERGRCVGVRVGSLVEGEDERSSLRFSSPLITFAIEVIATLDRDDPAYVVDVISVGQDR